MTSTPRQMGTTLKRLRTEKKLGQAALARRAGLSRSTSGIEAGRYDPPLSTLNSLAKAVGVPVTELLG